MDTWLGFEADALERARRPPARVRWWVALLLLVPCLLAVAVGFLAESITRKDRLDAFLAFAFSEAPFTMGLERLEVLPVGDLWHPETWRVELHGLSFKPHDPKKPEWILRHAVLPMPHLDREAGGYVLHFAFLHADGLTITAHQQRRPPPWEPKDDLIRALVVDEIVLRNAGFSAPRDEPIGAASLQGIEGRLSNLMWRPGRREVSGEGQLSIRQFRSGAIELRDVQLSEFKLSRSDLAFDGDFAIADKRGDLTGTVDHFHTGSEVLIALDVDGLSVGDVVELATGTRGPVAGKLDLELKLRTGGQLPRGGAVLDGVLELHSGRIELARDTNYLLLDLITVAPWVRLDAANHVLLDDTRGRIRFSRGVVQLKELRYPAGKREIRVDGTIQRELLWLVIRLSPPPSNPNGPGFGLVLYGSPGSQRFRLAKREDLVREDPWVPRFDPDVDLPEVVPRREDR